MTSSKQVRVRLLTYNMIEEGQKVGGASLENHDVEYVTLQDDVRDADQGSHGEEQDEQDPKGRVGEEPQEFLVEEDAQVAKANQWNSLPVSLRNTSFNEVASDWMEASRPRRRFSASQVLSASTSIRIERVSRPAGPSSTT